MMQEAAMALLPALVIAIASLVLMMQIAFWRNVQVSWVLTCGAILFALMALPDNAQLPLQVTPLLIADQYGVFFSILILFGCLITALIARDYLEHRRGENEEFYLLLLLSGLGGLILVSATHLASFLLGLELLGVALYALIAYPERGHLPLEAATKYLILSGAASAILLFGFALIYAALGSLSFAGIGEKLAVLDLAQDKQLLVLIGTGMVFTGIGFKLSLVPFHMWTPDVYQGAPSPVTGFLATVSKGAIFAALMRLFIDAGLYNYAGLMAGLSAIAIASMLAGNLLALQQDNLKRLLAYSSIAHLGYLIITLVVVASLQQPQLAIEAAGFYLTAYIVTSLAAFSLLTIISSDVPDSVLGDDADLDDVDHLRGLFWQRPLLALLLTVALLSLAGIPLTIGFVGKFYLFAVGIEGSLWWLIGALVVGSGIGIYYYLRVVFIMSSKVDNRNATIAPGKLSLIAKLVICALLFIMVYLGVMPQSVMDYLGSVALEQ
ncbi:MAG: NADH-quinone oxidoreductase subunit N [Gammaproteobacteria bacterium]|nr:NADH-quinone oxidoreductase subunit N [Gammaproteobacteria bacterium]